MKRRHFLSVSALGGLGLAAATPAKALEVVDCDHSPGAGTCRRLTEHAEVLQRLDAMLAEKGLTPEQRKAALAAASCPFCGLPLVDGGGSF